MKAESTNDSGSKRRMRVHSAREKARAVLAVWSGRRSPSALTKELGVPWTAINGWEKRALAGMLTALDPGWKQSAQPPSSLPARVEKLMAQTLESPVATQAGAVN